MKPKIHIITLELEALQRELEPFWNAIDRIGYRQARELIPDLLTQKEHLQDAYDHLIELNIRNRCAMLDSKTTQ